VVVDAEVEELGKTTHRSERRSVLKKSLTGPTLLEMSGNPCQDLAAWSDDKFRVADHPPKTAFFASYKPVSG
jgi:hypothetical protein